MRLLVIAALLSTLGVAGCREGAGKRCQSSNDCHAGLVCILPIGGSPQTGGVCTDIHELGTTEPDQSVPLDLAGEDLAASVDAATSDDLL